ncbi:hypothetical protein BZA77DRAFT_147721 [Pyronema omphalodes]|nr:hypothetical protein BZA77DRAFT_147721 [Pyronema omphalodes]
MGAKECEWRSMLRPVQMAPRAMCSFPVPSPHHISPILYPGFLLFLMPMGTTDAECQIVILGIAACLFPWHFITFVWCHHTLNTTCPSCSQIDAVSSVSGNGDAIILYRSIFPEAEHNGRSFPINTHRVCI